MTNEPRTRELPERVDVLVVGAGLSGIGAAHRIIEANPDIELALVEAREVTGGTWDLFRYPGVRSDSDMFTLSFPFRPWTGRKAIADGADILDYIRETADETGVAELVHTGCRVSSASWSSEQQEWTVDLDTSDGPRQVRAGFVHLGSGYYDYEQTHDPGFEGVEDFAGQVIHPQFWPQDLDHAGKRVVVIGSGATAVTVVPAMAGTAAHVTMLQRTPSYVFDQPSVDPFVQLLRRHFGPATVQSVTRVKNLGLQTFLYQLSRRRPTAAKKIVQGNLSRFLPREIIDEHFDPPYDVWDQRLCAVPDGDLYAQIRRGAVSVVTGHVDRFVPEGVRLTDGRVVEADIVVTATGLLMKALGGIRFVVDGAQVPLARRFAYRGLMLAGVPNVTMTVGYVNASWTLRADLVSRYVAALVRHMRDRGLGVAVPVAPDGMTAGPILDLTSGYVQRVISQFPKVGDRAPWTMPQNYIKDTIAFRRADVTRDMHFVPVGAKGAPLPVGAQAPQELPLPGSSSNLDDSLGDRALESVR
ncbi:flavin-containing monooxygenase [Janibacter cremeus]|uniref:Cation diffusion facilitator CzcD-associated flavoprotein CzcO n=1 Tax=Janibacter cremeus TaxID=1285192 RepID=A0A852VR91_9MICO|nr:NAD(P)/FAD-dependent oxidoreductase [Janibacter cremeus]NYF98459.1 cation diffusion facilitator CzcD-associated flavoprotein CzcO [Janibacter cremeus]